MTLTPQRFSTDVDVETESDVPDAADDIVDASAKKGGGFTPPPRRPARAWIAAGIGVAIAAVLFLFLQSRSPSPAPAAVTEVAAPPSQSPVTPVPDNIAPLPEELPALPPASAPAAPAAAAETSGNPLEWDHASSASGPPAPAVAPASPAAPAAPPPVAVPAPAEDLRTVLERIEDRLADLEAAVDDLGADAVSMADLTDLEDRLQGAAPPVAAPAKSAPASSAVQKAARDVRTAKKSPRPTKQSRPAAPHVSSWVLRSARPGSAWISDRAGGDLREISVGQTVSGLGRVLSIAQDAGGEWVVHGTQGRIAR